MNFKINYTIENHVFKHNIAITGNKHIDAIIVSGRFTIITGCCAVNSSILEGELVLTRSGNLYTILIQIGATQHNALTCITAADLVVIDILCFRLTKSNLHRGDIAVFIFEVIQRKRAIQFIVANNDGIGSILVVLIVLAVALVGVLSSINGDADAIDGQTSILVACIFSHRTGNGEEIGFSDNFVIDKRLFACGQQNALPIGNSLTVDGEVNSFKQLCTAAKSADNNLILERKVSLVHNLEGIKIEGCTRLPQNVGVTVNIPEAERFTVKRISVRTHDIHIQSTCFNLGYCGCSGIGKPRESGADEHRNAQHHGKQAEHQCLFGRIVF